MPANNKVSVGWQIVLTFLPIVNFWAFYRIRKLRKYVLFVIVPSIILTIAYTIFIANLVISDPNFGLPATDPWFVYTNPMGIAVNVIGWSLTGLSIYLVIIWSRLHNRQFDQPTSQTQPSL